MGRLESLLALARWLQEQKGTHAAADKMAIEDYGEAGFGFQATKKIDKGEVLCLIPVQLTWSALTAKLSKEPLGPILRAASGLREDDLVALHLMHERAMVAAGTPGERAAHVACLPASYDSTLFWSPEELAELAGCNLLIISARLQMQVESDFDMLERTVIRPNPAAFPPDHCGLDAYRWALGTIWSRSMEFQVSPTASLRCIVPWADMFNNDSSTQVCHAYEAGTKSVAVMAGRDYRIGEQVCINYGLGKQPAAASLRLYGFLPEGEGGQANVAVELYAEMAPQAEAFEKKAKLLEQLGVEAGRPHLLSLADPLPDSLLKSLRTQRLSLSEARDMLRMGDSSPLAKGRRISASNERMALSALASGLQAMLGQFATAPEEDEALLLRGDLPPRTRAAVLLRAAERRVLRASEEEAEQRLMQLDPAKDPRPAAPAAPAATAPAAAPAEEKQQAEEPEPPARAAAEVLADYFRSLEAGGEEQQGGGADGGAPAAVPQQGAGGAGKGDIAAATAELEGID